jgi:diguanylate cyclase (GGDEF)-like protein
MIRVLPFSPATTVSIMAALARGAHAYSSLLAFVTQTLSRSASILFGFITLITVSCVGYDFILIEQEKTASIAKQDRDARNTDILVALVELQKQVQIDVVQVQQYLSDFSATRGQDGQDGGLDNAARFAQQFPDDIAAAKKAAEAFGSLELVEAFSDLERRFPKFYGQSLEMAKVYAAQGPSAGNKLMADFGAISEELQEQLKLTGAALATARQRHSAEAVMAKEHIDELRNRATRVALEAIVITAFTCLLGIFIVRKWLVQPLGWVTFAFKQLAGGDTRYEVYEVERTDEIGDLGRAYANFRQVTLDRQKHSREMRLLAELNEWLQCCKSLDELYQIVAEFLTVLLPNCAGSLYIYANSRDVLDCAKAWNGGQLTPPMQPDDCWSLRRGRVFTHGENEIDFTCSHVEPSMTGDYCCIPILAHGDTIGLLHLHFGAARRSEGEQARKEAIVDQRRLGLLCAEQISMAIANVKLRDQLRDQSIRDVLTGLFNRRYLLDTCRREFSRAMRAHQSVSILSIDVDHFKKFNDNHGHDAGDTVLRAVGQCLEEIVRDEDIACRFGGEEFVVVLPGAPAAIAARRAEELRGKIESLEVPYLGRNLPKITISIGVAAFPNCGDTPQAVIRAADAALYLAKDRGRNRVEMSPMINVSPDASASHSTALRQAPGASSEVDGKKHNQPAESLVNAA